MLFRAYWLFYKDIFPFIITFTLITKVFSGILTAIILFLTLGIGIGFLAYGLVKKKEYYFYYNLGLTKWKLFKVVFFINLIVGAPIVFIFLLIISWLFNGP